MIIQWNKNHQQNNKMIQIVVKKIIVLKIINVMKIQNFVNKIIVMIKMVVAQIMNAQIKKIAVENNSIKYKYYINIIII